MTNQLKDLKLDRLKDVIKLITEFNRCSDGTTLRDGKVYCPSCGGVRRMYVRQLFHNKVPPPMREDRRLIEQLPYLFWYSCVECDTEFTALIYNGANGPALAVLPSRPGGLATPHTPKGVAYYLDQAYKSQSVGANSGAVAMFRAALDHLLFEQGYKEGTLGPRIKVLEADIAAGKAPKWALDLETEYLAVMNRLGSGSMHTNDGDVKKQQTLDAELLAAVQETFLALLLLAYEVPHQKGERLKELRAKAQLLKK